MEVPSNTQMVEEMSINPEETSEIEEPTINFEDFDFEEEDLDAFNRHDGSIPSSMASQIESKIGTLPQSLQDVTLGDDEELESDQPQSANESVVYQDPFEVARRYLERHNIMQIFQGVDPSLNGDIL